MIHFTSDTHFFHRKLAALRGFASPEEMNEGMRKAWNRRVGPKDVVFHLGDVNFGKPDVAYELVRTLNGRILVVPGNHDKSFRWDAPTKNNHLRKLDGLVEEVAPLVELKEEVDGEEVRIVLCHFPLLVWNRCHYGAYHLHGHSHGSCTYPNPNRRVMDVGVDPVKAITGSFAPISLPEVVRHLRSRPASGHDRHRPAEASE